MGWCYLALTEGQKGDERWKMGYVGGMHAWFGLVEMLMFSVAWHVCHCSVLLRASERERAREMAGGWRAKGQAE